MEHGRLAPRARPAAPGLVAAFVLAASAATGGCLDGESGRPVGESCGGETDCARGLVCAYGRCRPACLLDRDCGPGQVCVVSGDGSGRRVCTLPDEAGCLQEGGRACPPPLVCGTDDRCHDPCELCAPPRECDEGVCYEVPAADSDADVDADGDVDAGADADLDAEADAVPDGGADAGPDADAPGDGGVVDGGSGESCRRASCPAGEQCCIQAGETTPTCRTSCSGLTVECTVGSDCHRLEPSCCFGGTSTFCTPAECIVSTCVTDASCEAGLSCCDYPAAGSPLRVCLASCP